MKYLTLVFLRWGIVNVSVVKETKKRQKANQNDSAVSLEVQCSPGFGAFDRTAHKQGWQQQGQNTERLD